MFYRYLTKGGDRWDTIAQEYYGNPYDYADIMAANPTFVGLLYLPAGQDINVPVRATTSAKQKVLPPWKR